MSERPRDKLDEFNEKLSIARYRGRGLEPWTANTRGIGETFEKIAGELENEDRKRQALEEAANNFFYAGCGCDGPSWRFRLDYWEKALQIYQSIGSPGAARVSENLKKEYERHSARVISCIAKKDFFFDFRDLIQLPVFLDKAGHPEQAGKYRTLLDAIQELASKDASN